VIIRFLADADFNQKIIDGLRKAEPAVDFLASSEGGTRHHPDPEVLRIAARAGRVLVSHDRGTMPIHFYRFIESQNSPGLILLPQELEIAKAIEELLLIWSASSAEEYVNQIRYVS
jgi:predicted nuclease of predicted toxin-antitoxin system